MANPLRSWTISRATQAGIISGLAALVLWPAFAIFHEPLRLPFAASLIILGSCGFSIIVITALDLKFHGPRGARVRNMRIFDVALALLMMAPGAWVLPDLFG